MLLIYIRWSQKIFSYLTQEFPQFSIFPLGLPLKLKEVNSSFSPFVWMTSLNILEMSLWILILHLLKFKNIFGGNNSEFSKKVKNYWDWESSKFTLNFSQNQNFKLINSQKWPELWIKDMNSLINFWELKLMRWESWKMKWQKCKSGS